MPVEDRKDTIAFIICVNNELYFEECRYYIEHLEGGFHVRGVQSGDAK